MKTVLTRLEVTRNSDLTEGRGRMVLKSYHHPNAIDEAYESAKGASTQGSDGNIHLVTYIVDGLEWRTEKELVYGWMKLPNGRWGNGWADDPEFEEYHRLIEKFGMESR